MSRASNDPEEVSEQRRATRRRRLESLAESLFLAIEHGEDDEAFRLIAEARSIAGRARRDGECFFLQALDQAIDRDRVAVVAALLEAGCPAQSIDESGGTPLIHAAWRGRLEIARILLGAGADPDILVEDHGSDGDPEIEGQCALHFALIGGHHDLVHLLEPITRPEIRSLAHEGAERHRRAEAEAGEGPGLSVETKRLFMSAQQRDFEGVKRAIAAGGDFDALLPPLASNRLLGSSPLSFAAGAGRPDLVDLLLEAGADPWLVDHGGRTAADFAALIGHHEIASSLRPPPPEDSPATDQGERVEPGGRGVGPGREGEGAGPRPGRGGFA